MFQIVCSDLFQLAVEAIVNPANRQAHLGWGSHVSEQIQARAGAQVQEERNRFGTIELGDAVQTSAGSFPYRYIIHAAVLDMFDFNPLFLLRLKQRTSDETLRKAVRTSLDVAHRLGVVSVGFSLMGSGIGAMPTETCARLIGEGATAHLFHATGTIQLAVPSESAFATLKTRLPADWF